MKTLRDRQPEVLYSKIKSTLYEERRRPGCGLFYDSSCSLAGRQSIQNRLNFMNNIDIAWTSGLSDHDIRITLKKSFFDFSIL